MQGHWKRHLNVSNGCDFGAEQGECAENRGGPVGKQAGTEQRGTVLGPKARTETSADRGWPLHLRQPRNWGRSHVRPPRGMENFSLDQGSHRRQGPSWRPLQSPCQAQLSSSARPPRRGQLPAQRAPATQPRENTLIPLPLPFLGFTPGMQGNSS